MRFPECFSLIAESVRRLLNPNASMPEIVQSIHEIHAQMYSITGILRQRGDIQEGFDKVLPFGVAISPAQAAECLFDLMRTTQFMRGVHAAIQDAIRRFPGQRIHVLYAGCGPYCLLILPIVTQFQAKDVCITLLDIHEDTIQAARKVVECLEIDTFIHEFVLDDATQYRFPGERVLHVVITETMKAALEREPQVSISANLSPQLREGGILIPERICIDAYFLDFHKEFEKMQHGGAPQGRIHLGRIFELTREIAVDLSRQFHISPNGKTVEIPCSRFTIPETFRPCDFFHLCTTIALFDSITLDLYQSQLNLPMRCRMNTLLRPGDQVEFTYRIDAHPHFECQKKSP